MNDIINKNIEDNNSRKRKLQWFIEIAVLKTKAGSKTVICKSAIV